MRTNGFGPCVNEVIDLNIDNALNFWRNDVNVSKLAKLSQCLLHKLKLTLMLMLAVNYEEMRQNMS